jgi:hypothetical protein
MSTMLQQTLPSAATAVAHTDPRQRGVRDNAGSSGARAAAPAPSRTPAAQPGAAAYRAPNALPAEPQGNVDPEIWSLLDLQERVFFADMAPGALSYSPGRLNSTQPVARGLRLDVRA